ncbi:MAG: tRNA (guanosine(46)-N7)-methyltransferase TrmB [Bacilli bacterium]|nr:tRNA (guanosine(46)-N7)-methyltransferase TrmB [Bacilli bacterium]MDY6430892.1 tRNA (guanosine(46)-N7)-methyltransferase TrmB [Bacilli bacterium]
MRSRHKKWALPYLEEHKEIVTVEKEEIGEFAHTSPLFLEVGCGKGDFILGMSSKLSGRFLGIEKESNVCAVMVKKLVEAEVTNVKILNEDFDTAYEKIKDIKFDKIFLNFSDPWPKKKQHKRRLTSVSRLELFGSLLKEEGMLVFKTDNDSLYEDTLEYLEDVKSMKMVENLPIYIFDETNDVMTEYERNFREQGKEIHKIVLKKEK